MSIDKEEPLHVTMSSCNDIEISVVVSHIDDVTGSTEWSALTVITGTRSLSFTKQLAKKGVYSFQVLVQSRPGSLIRFLRTDVPTFKRGQRLPSPRVSVSMRRSFSLRWTRVRGQGVVAYCAYVNRPPHKVGAHCPRVVDTTLNTRKDTVPPFAVTSRVPSYCGFTNGFLFDKAIPGTSYNVDVFAIDTETKETYAFPTVKVCL